MQGLSVNFINSFNEYRKQSKKQFLTLSFYGHDGSKEFSQAQNIVSENYANVAYYNTIKSNAGMDTNFNLYDPWDLMIKNMRNMIPFNQYNFSSYFSSAELQGLIKKKGSDILVQENFFISLDDGAANRFLFGDRNKTGYLIDIDTIKRAQGKMSFVQKFNIFENMNKMIVNVDAITSGQQQRRSNDLDIGFYVSYSPGNLVPSINVRNIDITLTRKNELPSNVPRII